MLIGTDIEISVNWDSFETVAQLQELQHQCSGRVVEGLGKIAEDDMGKEALGEFVKTISINYITDAAAKKVEVAGGTLTVDCKWEDFGSGIFTPGDYAIKIEDVL